MNPAPAVTDFGTYWVHTENGCTSLADTLSILRVNIEDVMIPNVFTPNGDGCNALFSAFSDRVAIDEKTGLDPCLNVPNDEEIATHCARFVDAVNFKVYNRWGKEVFNYSGDRFGQGGEKGIYIDWDGRDTQGHELSEGIYYYVATVTYDVVDPTQMKQTLKGWIHLIR